MSVKSYLNFDLTLSEIADRYQVEVTNCPNGGQAVRDFSLPVSGQQLEHFILNISRGGSRSSDIEQPTIPDVKELGKALYASLFEEEVEALFLASLKEAEDQGKGMRINLRFSDAPGLIGIPWELLTNNTTENPFVLSVETPIVRKLNLGSASRVRQSGDALRVLVMISNPAGSQPLDVEVEWRRINTATQSLQADGKVMLERVEPSLSALQQRLRERQVDYDVFHYIGHGGFENKTNDGMGVLLLEDAQGQEYLVNGQELGSILYDEKIQLVVLNSCNGARSSLSDPFAGVGQSLLQKRIPAVVAMQFEISDQAAIAFSDSFYAVLVKGYKVETAVAEARRAIYAWDKSFEWATPVLYTSTDEVSFLTDRPSASPSGNVATIPPLDPHVRGRLLTNAQVRQRGSSHQLAVVVHAWTMNSTHMGDVISSIETAMPDADLLVPDYPSGIFSNANPIRITEELVNAIQNAFDTRLKQSIEVNDTGYREIILVGHSAGALLVRKALVFAKGQTQDNERAIKYISKDWSGHVSRIILMGGLNRGWSLETKAGELSTIHWWALRFGAFTYRWTRMGKLINSMRQGSPFIVNLRIQWLNLVRSNSALPPTIQLLGTNDDIVSQTDNVDLQSDVDFIFKEVPLTGHGDIIQLRAEPTRQTLFLDALLTPTDKLHSDACPPLKVDNDISIVVFIMHGLGEYGHWTNSLGKHIERLGNASGVKVKAITASYGYFPMLRFLLQPEREDKVRWFADHYTQAMAQYPNARICFVGHSNGTYLLASALRRYAAMKFHDIVLTGSVVPYVYPWDKAERESRIVRLRNYVASRDWLVAIFPTMFEAFSKNSEVGSSGLNGFLQDTGRRFSIEYVKGGHYAAIAPENHDAIARFILGGEVPSEEHNPALITTRQYGPTVIANRLSRLIWLVVLAALGVVLFGSVVAHLFDSWNPETIPIAETVRWWMPPVFGPLIFSVVLRLF